jgi:endoglucanase
MKTLYIGVLAMFLWYQATAQDPPSQNIHLNQIGFYPDAKKLAVAIVVEDSNSDFSIHAVGSDKKLFEGKLGDARHSSFSPATTRIANFSSFTTPGTYVLTIPGIGTSYAFEIKPHVHEGVEKASLKGFYFQRFSTALTEPYAGKWKRRSSPSHDKIVIHPSAASEKRPAGSTIASPRGWIDAGDYNKYIVNSGITMGTLLSAYEDFPEYYDSLHVNIPESKNALPDILDEALWNLRWMLTMQDPDDGGVYHKCTNAKFDGMVMPDQAVSPRYVVQKGTAATLDFAAVTAQAARVLRKFEQQSPGLADTCLHASKLAWQWAQKNPSVVYDQKKMNDAFDPDVTTGAYGDSDFSDEFFWAAAELTATTGDAAFLRTTDPLSDVNLLLPSWNQVKTLGYYTLIRVEKKLPADLGATVTELKRHVVSKADELIQGMDSRYYNTVMGATPRDFVWGSSSVAANQGVLLIQAWNITGDRKYADAALGNLDYLLGRNATGYSFLTGVGDKTPMHIHHRPSEADGILDPVPGLLSGGPNPGKQDHCTTYPSSVPDEAYTDDVCSYASNEIAINWNAPLVYLAGALEAIQYKAGYSKR